MSFLLGLLYLTLCELQCVSMLRFHERDLYHFASMTLSRSLSLLHNFTVSVSLSNSFLRVAMLKQSSVVLLR